ncbi:hypothetical protein TNCV_4209551 [Trichonephila clavipes]|nr:hypothetical protein TNCV_4209551 [Trichonephila clavipes]
MEITGKSYSDQRQYTFGRVLPLNTPPPASKKKVELEDVKFKNRRVNRQGKKAGAFKEEKKGTGIVKPLAVGYWKLMHSNLSRQEFSAFISRPDGGF